MNQPMNRKTFEEAKLIFDKVVATVGDIGPGNKKSRTMSSHRRQVVWLLNSEAPWISTPMIAKLMGLKSHSTIVKMRKHKKIHKLQNRACVTELVVVQYQYSGNGPLVIVVNMMKGESNA
jgi:hypothetical protein